MRPPTLRRPGTLPQEAPELAVTIAAGGQLVRPSRAFQQAMGLTAETLTGRPVVEFVHPGDRGAVEGALAWLAENEGPIVFEARWRHADGGYRWLEWTVRGGHRDGSVQAGLRDVTPWKQDEALALAHVRVLEAIVLGLPLEETFGHVTALLEALGVDLFPAIHLFDPKQHALVLVAGAAFGDGFRRALEALPVPDGPGAAVVAARDKAFVVSPDLSRETHWRGRRELPLLHGVRAEWAHPVIDASGALLGTVTAFLTQPATPRPRDRQILALASQLVATALLRFRAADAPREDVEQLRAELTALEARRAEDAAAWETRRAEDAATWEGRLAAERSAWDERVQQAEAAARRTSEEASALRTELDGAQRAAGEVDRVRDAMQDALDEAQRKVDQLTLQKEELETRVVEAEVAQELLQGDLEQLQADAESRKGRSSELKKQLAEAEMRREGLEREIEAAREAVAERDGLVARLAEATTARDAVEQRLADLATLLAEARVAAAEAAAEPRRADPAEVEALRVELQESEAARRLLETGLSELRRAALNADAELRTLGMKVAEFDAVRAGLEQALGEMRERFQHADRRRGEAEAMLVEGRQALEEVIPLRAQLADSERRRAELEVALASARSAAPAVTTSADVDEDLAALHARLAESEAARRRLEEELATLRRAAASVEPAPAAAALLRTLFEGSAAPMVAVDEHGLVVFWNRTAAQLMGRSEAEVLGRELASVTGETVDGNGGNGHGEHGAARRTWRRPDGATVSLMVSSVPLPAAAERALTLLVALPTGDEELGRVRPLSSLDHLPGLAGGIARQVAELLAEIVAGTSQVRSPRGRATQKPLEAIEYVARRASELVRHLVVCAGEEIVEGESLDLTALVERLRGEMMAMLPPEIELHFRPTPHLPPMVGDAGQLRQVLAHLLTNSAEALEGRRGVISVATGLVDADRPYLSRTYFDDGLPEGRYLFLEVSDTGRGMEAETLEHLFEPQSSSKGAGRGLGLALVLGIVRAHHGALQVYSKPDVGTTVRVLLPTAGARARFSVEEARESPSVLIVDRDSAVRSTAARALEHWGFGVAEAGDVTEGVEALHEWPTVQLVVLEAALRNENSALAETLSHVRSGVRVLLAGEPNGLGDGGHGVVSRPFAPVELLAAVRAALAEGGRS
jgi:PAS domain S-box-containing protein